VSTRHYDWVIDITYVLTWSGFLYMAVVLDVFSRRIVGWGMADHLRTEPVLSALVRLRRRHQATAKTCHYTRRLALLQQLQL